MAHRNCQQFAEQPRSDNFVRFQTEIFTLSKQLNSPDADNRCSSRVLLQPWYGICELVCRNYILTILIINHGEIFEFDRENIDNVRFIVVGYAIHRTEVPQVHLGRNKIHSFIARSVEEKM